MSKENMMADLQYLYEAMLEKFSYIQTASVDIDELFNNIRGEIRSGISVETFGLAVQKALATFKDSHAGINVKPSPQGYLPFLLESTGNRYVAFTEDRMGFLEPTHPYISAIDDVDIAIWLDAAKSHIPRGSHQYVNLHSLFFLRAIQMLRSEMALPLKNNVMVTLEDAQRENITRRFDVSNRAPQYSPWPKRYSEILDGNIGYLRIERMSKGIAEELNTHMANFETTRGLIVDVRGNGGGTREGLLELFPYFMRSSDTPLVANVAAYRKSEAFGVDHLEARHLYTADSSHWNSQERAAITELQKTFRPELEIDLEKFSDWHYLVVSKSNEDRKPYYSSPVVVLSDARCFSATDVFISTFKGRSNATVLGQASSGGSARAQIVTLPYTGYKVRLASMASFRASGALFDGNGIQPDISVDNEPAFYIQGGEDNVLKEAIRILQQTPSQK